ncbi:HpcH/HpaI aldolase family protein [Streptomyces sp. NPDC003393]
MLTSGFLDGGLKARLRAGHTLLGTFAGLGNALAIEAASVAGADWVLVDLEHGGGGEAQVRDAVTAAGSYGVPLLVRVESSARIRAGRVLDLGAAGVMVPRVEDASEAARIVRALRYPPAGDRGVALYNRQAAFGLSPEILNVRNGQVVGVVQIETRAAVDDIEAIAATDGVDVVFVGPVDLSYALGVPMQLNSPTVRKALDSVLAAAERAGVVPGIISGTGHAAAEYARQGFRFLAVSSDASLLARAYRDEFRAGRGTNDAIGDG